MTKGLMPDDVRDDILNAIVKGEQKYLMLRNERFCEKTTRSSARSKGHNPVKKVKEINIVGMTLGRTLEIARDRGLTTDDLLKYDKVPSALLFDDDGMMTKQNAKCCAFDDLLLGFLTLITAKYHEYGRCDYIFDMYSNDPSVKDSERKRQRGKVPIQYSSIKGSTPVPKDMATFWPSSTNKLHVEKPIYSQLQAHNTSGNYPTVLGRISKSNDDYDCIKVRQGTEGVISLLQCTVFN